MTRRFHQLHAPKRCTVCERERTLVQCPLCQRWVCQPCLQPDGACDICHITRGAEGGAVPLPRGTPVTVLDASGGVVAIHPRTPAEDEKAGHNVDPA